jgi:hypothetical protein
VKIVVILSVAQFVTIFIFFSALNKSRVSKWDNSRKPTQKIRKKVSRILDRKAAIGLFRSWFLFSQQLGDNYWLHGVSFFARKISKIHT